MDGFFHVWFSTKRRKAVLEGEFSAEVKALLGAIARRSDIELIEVEALADHVHMLLRLHGNRTVSSAMHELKGASAREIYLRYPELRIDMGHHSFWQKGYGWKRILEDDVDIIRAYIRTQRKRPIRRNSA